MTSHDRVDMTMECLRRLFSASDSLDGYECKVFLVDDGSMDGTAECVRKAFPQVHIIASDGTLFWAKGMELAWKTAATERDWEGYLWLNDDTMLNDDGFAHLLGQDDGSNIVVGELQNASGDVVYGLRQDGLFTGNCVLVPQKVFDRLGMICGEYAHAWADSDYAQRAKRAGVNVVSGGVVGRAEGHPNRPCLKGRTFSERWRLLRDPKGWNVHDLWLYRRRNWGLMAAAASCVHLVLHVLWGER